uniref:Uncharacterized iron-regulated protein n=1 Tax=Candidatus Kentrum sp. FM TaxID=2126340 RepID=A0A450W3W0_9GAMM|nr:MAG: Uncharacterized iron-regulated protein [Candidatus Kentron sp. FM]VFJ72603.1 MAG: Uncharacterized iron-regulated protein [Candidatus Kentron sp. FM]VFK11710.1 MAG: Uncharacterized iron-regulated protein [Candidatus Kentron sp. FM]
MRNSSCTSAWRKPVCVLFLFPLLFGCRTIPPAVSQSDDIMPHTRKKQDRNGEYSLESMVPGPIKVIELNALPDADAIIPRLMDKQVVFIGERHTRFADHLNQLAIIRGLYDRGKELAIGMEFFQQPFQPYLDAYSDKSIAGGPDDTALLSHTEYYDRWRYDYRLYQPILHFARKRRIPLIALNISSEIVKKVSESGWDGLTGVESAEVPQSIDRSNKRYEQRLRRIFRHHPRRQHPGHGTDKRTTVPTGNKRTGPHPVAAHGVHGKSGGHGARLSTDRAGGQRRTDFQRFMDVQLLWDEGMAERAAKYLTEHPGHTLVVLAGSGHLAYGHGIPDRVRRRVPVESAIILPVHDIANDDIADDSGGDTESVPDNPSGIADFLLVSGDRALPPAGTLGILLETDAEGIRITSFTPQSPARDAGMEEGDRLVRIDLRPIETMAHVKLALWDKRPGDRVSVELHRIGGVKEMRLEVVLR